MHLAALFWSAPAALWQAEHGLRVAELLRGVGLAAAVAGLLLLLAVEFVYRDRLRRETYHWLLLFGLFVLPATAFLSTTGVLLEETKTVRSCASCHVMDTVVNDMLHPASGTLAARHYRNKWIPENQCYSCHTTYGVHGTLAAKRDGVRHWLLYVTRTGKEPIRFRGTYPNANCLICHAGTPKFEAASEHAALAADLASNAVGCIDCHGPPHPRPASARLARARP